MLSKKAEKAAKVYARKTAPADLCVARVTSGDISPGPYNILPILCSVHAGKTTAFVLLTCFLLRISDDKHVGVMNWVLPFNERTEQDVTKLLDALGWDGRVWPGGEPGWPEGAGKEEDGLRALVKGQNLDATMTFPPDAEHGNATLRQEVLRTSTDFPLPLTVENVGDPIPDHVEKLRQLAADPRVFGMGGL